MSFTAPTPANTKQVYPVVAAVDDATVQFWLDRAGRLDVDQNWPDYGADAQMAAAVHRMIKAGVTGVATTGGGASGLTRWRSGSADLQFSEAAAAQAISNDWDSTVAGADYLALLQRYAAGPRVTSPGTIPWDNCGYNGFAGPMPGLWPYQ